MVGVALLRAGVSSQRRRHRGDGEATRAIAGKSESFGSRGLHRHTSRVDVEDPGNVASHLIPPRRHDGPIGDEAEVTRSRLQVPVSQHGHNVRQKIEPADASIGRVGVGEMFAEIAERSGSQQRVAQRMADDVTIGMAEKSRLTLEVHSPEVQGTLHRIRMRIESHPNPDLAHGERRAAFPDSPGGRNE